MVFMGIFFSLSLFSVHFVNSREPPKRILSAYRCGGLVDAAATFFRFQDIQQQPRPSQPASQLAVKSQTQQ
uniref:Putative secreted protein n=1 Tax=Anopheles marajoara TaxID=58244 RepID=A0A2M4CEA1_9DIPT